MTICSEVSKKRIMIIDFQNLQTVLVILGCEFLSRSTVYVLVVVSVPSSHSTFSEYDGVVS